MARVIGLLTIPVAWMIGDPHIVTLDGLPYTFNGLGEYVLLKTQHDEFMLQGRTVQAKDDYGNTIEATSFTAFAAKDYDSDSVQIQVNWARDGVFSMFMVFSFIFMINHTMNT